MLKAKNIYFFHYSLYFTLSPFGFPLSVRSIGATHFSVVSIDISKLGFFYSQTKGYGFIEK